MHPFFLIAALIITVPLIEIYLLIKIGSVIGALPTILMVVLTAVLGAALLRQQGLAALQRFQIAIAKEEVPATELLEGVILLIGGILLLTPGFFTDAIGFLCLLPFSRKFILGAIWSRLGVRVSRHTNHSGDQRMGRVIEGEVVKDRDQTS